MKKRWFLLVAVIFWTVALMSSLLWNLYYLDANTSELVRSVGRAFFQEIEVTRLWNARHGGVYVPITGKVQPNPYLQAPNRDVVTTEGMKLTKVNPAFMTRQIAEIAGQESNIQYHITSLSPIRPQNRADEWEAKALRMFEEGVPDFAELVEERGVYRYMAPLFVKEACLACHAPQGNRVGDIRGGISVTMPAGVYVNAAQETKWKLVAIHVGIFLAGIAGLSMFLSFRERQMAILGRKKSELEEEVESRKRIEADLRELTALLSETNGKLQEANEKLKQMALVDGLTMIANRRYFNQALAEEWQRLRRSGKPLSLIMIDIDLFKAYNDVYGHLAGDCCLKQIAAGISSELKRSGDFVARYGGEEFAVVLPETDAEGAVIVGQKIIAAIARLQLPHAASPQPGNLVTVSMGLAAMTPVAGLAADTLLDRADKALYRAKEQGRNRLICCEG